MTLAWRHAYDTAPPIDAAPKGRSYIEGRGIPADLATAAGVRARGKWYGRPAVLFPIRGEADELVAVAGRYRDGRTDPKARSAGSASLGLFTTPGALATEPIVITEAPIDALSLAACGVPSVAFNGLHWPAWLPAHCAFRQVVIGFDADDAGDAAAVKLTPVLQSFGARVSRWRPSGGKDWNDSLRTDPAGLRFALFSALAAPRYRAAYDRLSALYPECRLTPHLELEQAIDVSDWQAFSYELSRWEAMIDATYGPVL